MCGKSAISFLLNPLATIDTKRIHVAQSISPLSSNVFARLVCTSATSLHLLDSTITPFKKFGLEPGQCKSSEIFTYASVEEEERLAKDIPSVVCEKQTFEPSDKLMRPMITSSKKTCARVRRKHMPICHIAGCTNFAVSRGCCVRHGGGTRCTISGCPNRAKLYNKCFQHGGFKSCAIETCTRKAKRYGYCWSHGGGRICEIPECKKVSTQGGLCWAHGGGNRCKQESCSRRAYQKNGYFCGNHAS